MLGVDIHKLMKPIEDKMNLFADNMYVFIEKIERVIELLEEISGKLDK